MKLKIRKHLKEQQTTVPDVNGKTMAEAGKAIDKAKLRPIVLGEGKYSNKYQKRLNKH